MALNYAELSPLVPLLHIRHDLGRVNTIRVLVTRFRINKKKKQQRLKTLKYTEGMWTYRGVINDDITAGHVAMEDVLLQMLDEGALKRQRDKDSVCSFNQDQPAPSSTVICVISVNSITSHR